MKRLSRILLLLLVVLLSQSCREKNESSQAPSAPAMMSAHAMSAEHTGVIQEVLQATEYTYLNLKEGEETYWIAIRKQEFKVGDEVSFNGGLEMRDFASKDLDRTFEKVLFVDQVNAGQAAPHGTSPMGMGSGMMAAPHGTSPMGMGSGKPSITKETVSVEPITGGTTIGELFGNRQTYDKKSIQVKGLVIKVNRGIMGRNWVHLQDGTESNGEYDLTLTTQDDVKEGDVAVFEGTVALNRDFGAGYKYDVIVEEATLKTD